MPTYSNLGALFTDIARAIREKKGSVDTINAYNFPEEIATISSGGIPILGGHATHKNTTAYGNFTEYTNSVDLGATKNILGATLFSYRRGEWGPSGEKIFVEVSDDNATWTRYGLTNIPNSSTQYAIVNFSTTVSFIASGRYVRYGVIRSNMGTGGHDSGVAGSVIFVDSIADMPIYAGEVI